MNKFVGFSKLAAALAAVIAAGGPAAAANSPSAPDGLTSPAASGLFTQAQTLGARIGASSHAMALSVGTLAATPAPRAASFILPSLSGFVALNAAKADMDAAAQFQTNTSVRDLSGKPVLLVFWGAYDQDAEATLSDLQALRTRFSASGLEIVAVSINSDLAALRDLQAKYGFTLAAGDGFLSDNYNVDRVPTFFLIDKAGLVQWTMAGRKITGNPQQDATRQTLSEQISTRLR